MSMHKLFPLEGSYPSSEMASALTSLHTCTPGHTALTSDDDECYDVTDITPRRSNSIELSSLSALADTSLPQVPTPRAQSVFTVSTEGVAATAQSTSAPRQRLHAKLTPLITSSTVTFQVPTFSPLRVRVVSPLKKASEDGFDRTSEAGHDSHPASPLTQFAHLKVPLTAEEEEKRREVRFDVTKSDEDKADVTSLPIAITGPTSPDFSAFAAITATATPADPARLGATWSAVSVCAGAAAMPATTTALHGSSPHSLSGSAATFVDHGADDSCDFACSTSHSIMNNNNNNSCSAANFEEGETSSCFDATSRCDSGTFQGGSATLKPFLVKSQSLFAGLRAAHSDAVAAAAVLRRPPLSPCGLQPRRRCATTATAAAAARLAPHHTSEYAKAVREAAKYRWTLKEILAARVPLTDEDDDGEDENELEEEDALGMDKGKSVRSA